jgi:NTE family protein
MSRALVLGGGGVAGIAWETGVLAGLAEAGVHLPEDADLVLGTSAGSTVGAQATSGLSLPDLLARQTDPDRQAAELPPGVDVPGLIARFVDDLAGARDAADEQRRIGAIALAADTRPEADRLAVIRSRLPEHDWPTDRLRVTAVDAHTGELVLFDRASGVPLVDAVAASCAVPGVWPPVTINGRRYVDGGMRSSENADLAAGHDVVLVLRVLSMPVSGRWAPTLEDQVAELRAAGARVEVVATDEASQQALTDNPLDPATRTPAALAGLAQGRAEAERIAAFWR